MRRWKFGNNAVAVNENMPGDLNTPRHWRVVVKTGVVLLVFVGTSTKATGGRAAVFT